MKIDYKPPGQVAKNFMKSEDFVRGLRGPVGSGKSVACCFEIMRKACSQKIDNKGLRRSRWAVIRNTNPQLKTTTIKTWRDWFGDDMGKFNWSPPYTHHMRFGLPDKSVVEAEIIFLALDNQSDVKKLLSLELTGLWINEAREIPKSIVDACTMRVGRFPSMKDGGPTWSGVIMDTNSPDETHWWGIMSGEVPTPEYITDEEKMTLIKPDDWQFFTQPGAMVEKVNKEGVLEGYEINKERENAENLKEDYYNKIILGKSRPWVKVYVLNKYQTLMDGKAVYPMFKSETHVSNAPIKSTSGEILVGIDFGRTPAAVFCQQSMGGKWKILHELIANDMGATRFSEVLKHEIARQGWSDNDIRYIGDPAGNQMAQTDEHTPFMILRANGINAVPATTNDPMLRVEAVENVLNRMVEGNAAFQISPTCPTLIAGFEGGYQYRRMQVVGQEKYDERPNKNRFSHIHDALQYAVIGGGEGRKVTTNSSFKAKATVVQRSFNPFGKNRGRKVANMFRRF